METDNERLTPLDVRLRDFEQVLTEHPDDLETLSAYGEASLLRGHLMMALRSFQRLVALQPGATQHLLMLAKVYFDCGLVAEAASVVGQVLDSVPGNVEGHILLRRLSKANGSVDPSMQQRVADSESFLPSPEALAGERERVEVAIAQLDAEHAQLAAASAEPADEFAGLLVSARRQRMLEALAEIERWEALHRQIEDERRRLEDEERRRFEEEERARREHEEAERLRLEEEERVRREQEEAERRRLEEEERIRREHEEAERLRLEEEERVRREQEEAERRRLEEEERIRREQEEAERRRLEEEERIRREQEEEERRGTREREEAYGRLSTSLAGISSAFLKTKGVSAVLVMARDGFLVHESHLQEVDVATFSTFVVDAYQALSIPGDALGRWKVWVLEFPKGILVLHKITPDYFLVVYGQTGANFGLLTLLIDKNKAQLEGVLGEAPAVP